jgi:ABC-type microcin C transport system permease subunit YejE
VVARLLYGFRISVLFALALTVFGTVIGVLTGAIEIIVAESALLNANQAVDADR